MPVNHYECLILLDTSKSQGNADAVKGQLRATLDKHGVEVIVARNWDERKLAYPIGGQKKGLYYLLFFKGEASKIDPIQADLRLNENVLRFMTQKIPAKWLDEMMAVVRDDHRLALQALRDEGAAEEGSPIEGVPVGEEGHGDRRRRRPVEAGAEGKE
jgi:small subunit ribosomal protein S6